VNASSLSGFLRFSSFALIITFAGAYGHAADPLVSNVRAAQRPGTKLVDISYDVADPDSSKLTVTVAVSDNAGVTYAVPASSFSGDVGPNVTPGKGKRIVWDAGRDWPGKFSANMRFRVTADDGGVGPAPTGMVLIPAGSFQMGNCMDPEEGWSDELPVHTVYVSAFYMDQTEVTKALWDEVYTWAIAHGYNFDFVGAGKGPNHPVHTVDWYDVVKWCNARSEREGRVPTYYTSAAKTTVYRTGRIDVENDWVKWNAGYRLPTEAEWEKAARGGLDGRRFPWGDTISHSQANYSAIGNPAIRTTRTM
jgi:formylglycine-generating enzyme required for sulfatase activity